MIVLKNVTKVYSDKGEACVDALRGVSLEIREGEMVAVMGPSGSGKSTLLNIIGCLDKKTSGQYILDGKEIEACSNAQLARLRNEMFGFVIQDFSLVSDWNVFQNVRVPLIYSHEKVINQVEIIDKALQSLGIYEKKYVPARNLSGGQKQRVAIARAIINNPKIVLADEPTGSLDSATGQEVLHILKNINNCGKTVVIVTHDINIAKACDRIITISDGKIVYS